MRETAHVAGCIDHSSGLTSLPGRCLVVPGPAVCKLTVKSLGKQPDGVVLHTFRVQVVVVVVRTVLTPSTDMRVPTQI